MVPTGWQLEVLCSDDFVIALAKGAYAENCIHVNYGSVRIVGACAAEIEVSVVHNCETTQSYLPAAFNFPGGGGRLESLTLRGPQKRLSWFNPVEGAGLKDVHIDGLRIIVSAISPEAWGCTDNNAHLYPICQGAKLRIEDSVIENSGYGNAVSSLGETELTVERTIIRHVDGPTAEDDGDNGGSGLYIQGHLTLVDSFIQSTAATAVYVDARSLNHPSQPFSEQLGSCWLEVTWCSRGSVYSRYRDEGRQLRYLREGWWGIFRPRHCYIRWSIRRTG